MTGDQPMGVPPAEGRGRIKVDLTGVPESALWTLYHRAAETRRPDAVLYDPVAVDLVERLDYPFAERFGAEPPLVARLLQSYRVRLFDREVEDFLARCPRGTVVCLGDGLETQYWRVDNGRAQWVSVDLPESIALRERLLPPGPRQRLIAASATDPAWLDQVDAEHGVLVIAQGLLMYLHPAEVRDLLAACAERFPGGSMVFDTVPHWFARAARQGRLRSPGYQVPPMYWSMDPYQRQSLATASPRIQEVRDVVETGGGGLLGRLWPVLQRLPVVAGHRPSVVALRFADRD